MSYLTKKEKLQKVLELCEKLNITAYNIGGNTPLNTSGVQRILSGEEKDPRPKTVNTIYEYLIKYQNELKENVSQSSTAHPDQAAEPETKYSSSIQELVDRQVYKDLHPILAELIKQQQQTNRILIKNSLNIDELKDELSTIKKSLIEVQAVVVPKK